MSSLGKFLYTLVIFLNVSCSSAEKIDYKRHYSKEESGSQFMTIDGQSIHYRVFGEGRPILLLHGICDSLHTWRFWKDGLVKNGYKYIAIDLPGYGLTGKWNKPYSTDNYLTLISKVLDNLKVDKAIIAGNSLGGYMAWNFALKHPERVEKLVLVSPAAYPMSPPFVVHFGKNSFTRWISKTFSNKYIYTKIAESVFYNSSKMTDYDIDRFYHLSLIEGNHEAYMDTFQEILKLVNIEPKLTELKTETLLLWGKYDEWIPHSQSKLWQRDVLNLEFISYDKVGHVSQLEIPKKSLEDVLNFLKNSQ